MHKGENENVKSQIGINLGSLTNYSTIHQFATYAYRCCIRRLENPYVANYRSWSGSLVSLINSYLAFSFFHFSLLSFKRIVPALSYREALHFLKLP